MKDDMMKTISEFPNYAITKDGKVWSRRNKIWLKQILHRNGYLYVCLCGNGKQYKRFVHKLILETFVGPRPEGMECRHLDDDSSNNKLSNLRWGTHRENMQDTIKHRGRNGGNLKLTEADVRKIVSMYETDWFTIKELAGLYSVSLSCIGHIVEKRNWKHLWNKST